MNKADKIAKKVVAAEFQELEREIDQAHDDLFSSEAKENATLPESIFVAAFLPMFSGKVKDDRKLNITTNWIGVAGSAMNPVDVISDQTGEKIYTVPPLMSSNFLHEPGSIRGKTFGRIFADAQLQAARLPALGQTVISEGGTSRLNQMNPEVPPDAAKQWSAILKRYNIAEPVNSVGNRIAKQSKQDDELLFD